MYITRNSTQSNTENARSITDQSCSLLELRHCTCRANFSIPFSDPRAQRVSKYARRPLLIADIWVQIDPNVCSRRKHVKAGPWISSRVSRLSPVSCWYLPSCLATLVPFASSPRKPNFILRTRYIERIPPNNRTECIEILWKTSRISARRAAPRIVCFRWNWRT